MKYSHDGLIYSYVSLLLHLSCWYYLTVGVPKGNFLFSEFEEIWGGFLENLQFLRRLEEIWEISNLSRFGETWGGVATLQQLLFFSEVPNQMQSIPVQIGVIKWFVIGDQFSFILHNFLDLRKNCKFNYQHVKWFKNGQMQCVANYLKKLDLL